MNLIQLLNPSDVVNAVRDIYINSLIFIGLFFPAFALLLFYYFYDDD